MLFGNGFFPSQKKEFEIDADVGLLFHQSINDCSIDGLIDWLIDIPFFDCSVERSVDWLIGYFVTFRLLQETKTHFEVLSMAPRSKTQEGVQSRFHRLVILAGYRGGERKTNYVNTRNGDFFTSTGGDFFLLSPSSLFFSLLTQYLLQHGRSVHPLPCTTRSPPAEHACFVFPRGFPGIVRGPLLYVPVRRGATTLVCSHAPVMREILRPLPRYSSSFPPSHRNTNFFFCLGF